MLNVVKSAVAVMRTARGKLKGADTRKVFAIGFNKTATFSIDAVFRELGLHSYHGQHWRSTSRPVFYWLYDAFSDGVPDDFRRLDRRFPGSRFILQVRDLDTWIDSRLEHIKRTPEALLRTQSSDWSIDPESIRAWVERRNRHHLDVLDYFRHRREDLLLINFIRDPDAAGAIARFLGDRDTVEKPHRNSHRLDGDELRNHELIATTLESMSIPRQEWQYDIYCPSLLGDRSTCSHPSDTDGTLPTGRDAPEITDGRRSSPEGAMA